MPTPLLAANWKMHGHIRFADDLVTDLLARLNEDVVAGHCDVLFCVPDLLLRQVVQRLEGTPFAVGGQDAHPAHSGAHTGETSATMLADAGATHVILGHSERRSNQGEEDALVASKASAAIEAGLIPLICLGESLEEREAGRAEAVVALQLAQSLPSGLADTAEIIVAYEPVWAIGTGKVPSLEEIESMHSLLAARLADLRPHANPARILYGGSLKPDNAQAILALPHVDGGLIGGASLKSEDFHAICRAALRMA